jgi:hypothetical protein
LLAAKFSCRSMATTMRKQALLYSLLFAVLIASIHAACNNDNKPTGSPNPKFLNVPVSNAILADVDTLFPSGQTPHPSVASSVDILLKLETASNLTFTFVSEGAGNRNQFGYFLYDPTSSVAPNRVMIFPDCTWDYQGGCMYTGSSVQVGPIPAKSQVGFWIKSDGYVDSNGQVYYSVHNTSTPVKSPDGYRHTAWVGTNGVILIGFEDLYNLGDKDYNDVMFFVTVSGQYNDDDVPKYENGTLQVCSDAEITTYTEFQCTQYAALTARNPSSCIGYLRVPSGWTLAPDTLDTRNAVVAASAAGVSFGSQCVVLAGGKGVNVKTGMDCGSGLIKVFKDDSSCFNVACEYVMLIKGQTLGQCSGSQDLTCNPATNAKLLSRFPSTQVDIPVYPSQYNIYLSNLVGTAATIDLPVIIKVPSSPKVDVMVLVDLNGLSSANLATLRTQVTTLFNSMNSKSYNPLMGIATIDASGNVNVLTTLASSSATITNALNNIQTSGATAGSTPITQALLNSFYSNTGLGWRQSGTYNSVLVITSKTFSTAVDLVASSRATRVFPIFLATSTVSSSYSTLASSQPFAFVDTVADAYGNIATKAISLIDTFVKTVKFDTAVDLTPNGFVSSLPTTMTGLSFSQTLNRTVTLRYPTGTVSLPNVPFAVNVAVWGFGTLTINVNVNRAPTAVAKPTINLNEDSSVSFEVAAQDADNNVLNVVYLSVSPASEQSGFKTSAGAALSFNTASYTDFSGLYVPSSNYYGTTVLSFLVRDGCVNSTVGTLTFQVTNVNDAPVARPIWRTIAEDTDAVIYFNNTIITDVDNDWSTLTVKVQSFPLNDPTRLAIGNAAGSSWTALTEVAAAPITVTNKYLRYTPTANWNGQVTFSYFVQDPASATSSSTITILVNPVNDAPTSQNIVLRTNEDTPIAITPTGTDVDGDTLTFEVVSLPNVGTVVRTTDNSNIVIGKFVSNPNTWTMRYTPPANQFSTGATPLTTFTFRVNDPNGGVSPVYTVSIFVDPINDPPTAADFSVTTNEDTSVSISFTPNIADVDDVTSTLKVYIKSPPLTPLGRLVDGSTVTTNNVLLVGQTVTFQPFQDQNGEVTFTYYVKDAAGLVSNDATVRVTVNPVNDPPRLTAPTTSYVSKVFGSVSVTLSMTDPDLGSGEQLTLRVTDNQLGDLVPNLNVTSGFSVGTYVASAATPNLATNWPNSDDGSALVTILTWNPTVAQVPGTSGTFTVRATDKVGATSNSVVITLSIADNTPPTVTTPITPTIDEDTSATDIRLFGTDVDAIDTANLTLTISQLPANGRLKHNGAYITATGFRLTVTGDVTGTWGFVDYEPNMDYNGGDSYKFFASDKAGASSAEATGLIIVNPINDAPVGSSVIVRGPEDTIISITTLDATDVDGDTLTLKIVTMPALFSAFKLSSGEDVSTSTTVTKPDSWVLNYTPLPNARSEPVGSPYTTFTYQFTDGNGGTSPVYTATIIVDPVNDPPVADDFAVQTAEDTNVVIDFSSHVSDIDGDTPLTIIVRSLPEYGTLYSGADGQTFTTAITSAPAGAPQQKLQFRPTLNANGETTFSYTVTDPSGASDSGVVTITITPVNDPPVSQSVVLRTLEDTTLNFTLSGTDIENDAVTLVLLSLPTRGDLTNAADDFYIRDIPHSLNAPAAFSYIPPENFYTAPDAPLVFNFYAFDGTDRSVLDYAVTIYVDSVNDAPTSQDVFVTTPEDTPVSFDLSAIDAEDDSTLLVAVVTGINDGDVRGVFYTSSDKTTRIVTGTILTNPRTIYFVPAANAYSNPSTAPLASLKFQVRDTEGLVSVAEYNALVYVTPVNDPATYNGASEVTIDEDTSIDLALMNQVKDVDDTVSSDMTVTVTAITGRGTFSECSEDVNNCERTTITVGYVLQNPEWRFNFVPLKDENGNKYASITFVINDGHDNSIPYTITVNVRPVNDPPVVNAFYNVLPGRVDMDEDTVLELAWNITDIDSPLNTLRTFVTSKLPTNGKMFACNVQDDGSCARGDELSLPSEVTATNSATATWRVLFVPDENAFDAKNFATFNLVGEDDHEARSVTVKAIIRVLPINDAPTITSRDSYQVTRDTEGETRFILSDVAVHDIDAFKKKIIFGVRLTDENSGRLEVEGSNADLAFKGPKAPCKLNEAKTEVVCNDPQADINVWISSAVVFYPANTAGTFNLFLYVDDLGNTDKLQRPLTANKTITVLLNEDTGLLPDTPVDNTGIAVGLSVGGAVAIAGIAVLIAKLRKKNDVIDNYFDNLTDSIQTGANNPMYRSAFSESANPLYLAKQT